MSRSVFEYYFDPEELGPLYSELVALGDISTGRSVNRGYVNGVSCTKPVATFEEHVFENNQCEEILQVREHSAASYTINGPDAKEVNCNENEPDYKAIITNSQDSASAEAKINSADEIEVPAVSLQSETKRSRVRKFFSVHAFGQFVFCKRAGILATESDGEIDADEPMPRLTFLPNFDREKIEELLSANIRKALMALLYIFAMAVFIVVGILEQNRMLVLPLLIVFAVSIVWFFDVTITIVRLTARWRCAIKAESRSPDPEVTELQQANWWSMLKAGFEPVNYQRPFRHPELPLEGCPWRVLERDSLRIPVIRAGGNRIGNRKGELFPKLHARIVAYSVLLEAAGNIEVPYGLVFPQDSPNGLAIPITQEVREKVGESLTEFVSAITESQQNQLEPALPENRNRCDGCAFGKPEAISKREIETRRKSGLKLVTLHNYYGDTFHCQCSDRFGTVPPHSETGRRRLVAAIE